MISITWDQTKLIEEAGIGSMELHTWIAAAAAHKAAGGEKARKLDFYSVAPEIGIAAGSCSRGLSQALSLSPLNKN